MGFRQGDSRRGCSSSLVDFFATGYTIDPLTGDRKARAEENPLFAA
jgi:hypothetical protein